MLFAGLGNPGGKYERNRHNIGFMALDRIAEEHGFSPWRKKFQGEVSEGRLGATKVILLKPQTFMNNSGQSVGEAMRFYKFAPEDVLVFHDEIDLAPAKVRVKTGGGHAGHNGLRSIHAHIGETYGRVRLGVGHPGAKEKVPGYVLSDFAKADADWLDPLIDAIAKGAARLAEGDHARFMSELGQIRAPKREPAAKASEAPKPAPAAPPDAAPKSKLAELLGRMTGRNT